MAQSEKIIKNLFYYIQAHLFGADPDKGQDLIASGQFGVMMTPGQFVNPNLMETDGTVDMWAQYELLNEVLDTSFAYKPLATRISRQYQDALENVALPRRRLTDDEEDELEDIGKWIQKYLPRYNVYRDRYYDAMELWEQERSSQHPNPARLARLEQNMNDAYAIWDDPYSGGRKSMMEDKRARAWEIQTGNPGSRWLELNTTFRNNRKASPRGNYYQTFLLPPVSTWNNANWASFSKTINETETHNYSRSVSWSGSFGARWGLFNHVNVGTSGERTVTHDVSDVTTIECQMDYLRVRIQRPWLDPDIFSSQDWTWKRPTTWHLLSDGGSLAITPPVRPIGSLPFMQTHAIVAKNVFIRADFSHRDVQSMYSRINGSLSAGFGPFSVRGSYTETTQQTDVRASFDGTNLRIPNPQIIGFLGTLMPRTPNPPPTAPTNPDWPKDAVYPPKTFEEYESDEYSQFATLIRRTDADVLRQMILLRDREFALIDEAKKKVEETWRRARDGEKGGGESPRILEDDQSE
jgi:hypothetical protein